ncbi:Uu.00g097270.m01.CDS01 [Anthostomella pinea]|uniref:Uu.00g097270.m01.CDS01 n=1 Tax=Anthostomella pinea TaxID=933095 RepID=A0AAI8VCG0_9PEZI|nr:Uu.00g097270.m01.CDS01 [Anthostomella pinea]
MSLLQHHHQLNRSDQDIRAGIPSPPTLLESIPRRDSKLSVNVIKQHNLAQLGTHYAWSGGDDTCTLGRERDTEHTTATKATATYSVFPTSTKPSEAQPDYRPKNLHSPLAAKEHPVTESHHSKSAVSDREKGRTAGADDPSRIPFTSHQKPPKSVLPRRDITISLSRVTSVVEKLLTTRWASLCHLQAREDKDFDLEAESKYDKFVDFLRSASRDRATPENDPLRQFQGRWIGFDQVTVQGPDPDSPCVPYIRFRGIRNEQEVKRLHATLSKRRFWREYHPPLRICFLMEDITVLASSSSTVTHGRSTAMSGPSAMSYGFRQPMSVLCPTDALRAVRPSSDPLKTNSTTNTVSTRRPRISSLCGTTITLGTGASRRLVTIGGIITLKGEFYAITASHTSQATAPPPSPWPLVEKDIEKTEYDGDIDSPLVFTTQQEHMLQTSGSKEPHESQPSPSQATNLARIDVPRTDWALVMVQDPRRRLANFVRFHNEHDTHPSDPIYLTEVAPKPQIGLVHVYGGISKMQQLTMASDRTYLRMPSGELMEAWKAYYTSGPSLSRGDSGAWVFDHRFSVVYGQVIATTSAFVYVLPLVNIFKEIREATGFEPRLPTPFERLSELAKLHFLQGDKPLAEEYAREALTGVVLGHSDSTGDHHHRQSNTRFLADFLNFFPQRRGLVCQVVMRTGSDIATAFAEVCKDAQAREMGDVEVALSFLQDLQTYAEDYGLDLSITASTTNGARPGEARARNRYSLVKALYPGWLGSTEAE